MPAKSICGGPITTRLLILCIFIGILCALCASLFCVQRGKKAIRFGKGAKKSRKIWHSYWSFSEWRSGKHGSEGVKGAVCSSCIWALLSVADLCWLRLLVSPILLTAFLPFEQFQPVLMYTCIFPGVCMCLVHLCHGCVLYMKCYFAWNWAPE